MSAGLLSPLPWGYGEICQMMGLDLATGRIGYKWDNERTNIAAHGLANATDWKHCLESGIGQTERARRTRTVTCRIKNLDLPVETAGGLASAAPNINNKKRKSARSSLSSSEKKTFDYTKEFRELKRHLACVEHKGDHCWVSTADGYHHRVDGEHTSLWAKEISVGNATKNRPPENIMFQDFFVPAPKRAHRTEPSTNLCAPAQAPPAIHVTVNTGTTTSTNVDNIPTSDVNRTEYRDISAYGSENAGFGFEVRYLPVTDISQQIDDSGKFVDSISFPTIIFADALAEECQITRVDHVPLFNTETYVHDFKMPPELAMIFVEQSILAMGRAEKGKGKE
ncbi:hypothetical protein B0H14DRAFT_2569920 [Mycena olivaceomarginata]|nr:hypothetical protein B0H14DRAFT_2569920 [Mycena olivaceomarginata]